MKTCPLCGGELRRVANDPWNRVFCVAETCWFHANAVPHDVAQGWPDNREPDSTAADETAIDSAVDNAYWFGFACAGGLAAAIAAIVWFLS